MPRTTVHLLLVHEQIRVVEKRQQNTKHHESPLLLFICEMGALTLLAEQAQIGIFQDELQEIAVFVRQPLKDILLFLAVLALLQNEYENDKRQAENLDEVEGDFRNLERAHETWYVPRQEVESALRPSRVCQEEIPLDPRKTQGRANLGLITRELRWKSPTQIQAKEHEAKSFRGPKQLVQNQSSMRFKHTTRSSRTA